MDSHKETNEVEFMPPKGFRPPENEDPTKDWDLVCSFRTKPDGKICMTKLGDSKMPGYGGEQGDTQHKQDYGEYAKGISDEMSQSMPQPAGQ